MRYERAADLEEKIRDIVKTLGITHVNLERIACFRSYGTNSRRVVARCHGLPKVMQLGMNTDAFYVIEVLTERFERMSEEEQTKVLIHELLHIPKSFGGGFRQHDYVNRKTVDKIYSEYKLRKERDGLASESLDRLSELEIERIKLISDESNEIERVNKEERKDWLAEKLNKFFMNKKAEYEKRQR
ncbi:MAG: putative metallopeptidase [Candidatus Micrarchaeota archaeon]|nr:putative metallopeptidase [Candidatus Micrarchaeota archaeon]